MGLEHYLGLLAGELRCLPLMSGVPNGHKVDIAACQLSQKGLLLPRHEVTLHAGVCEVILHQHTPNRLSEHPRAWLAV